MSLAPRATPQAGAAGATVTHRPMAVADLDAVMAVEASAYSHPWTRGNFIDSLAAGYDITLRLQGPASTPALIGYGVVLPGVAESHLLNLTVAPSWQRRGHARALLALLAARCRARGDEALWLEVRESNAPARALYRREGFAEVGLRRGYYPADRGREDAVVMKLDLAAPAAAGLAGGRDALG